MKMKLTAIAVCFWLALTTAVFAEYTPEIKNIVAKSHTVQNVSARIIDVEGEPYISIDDILKGSGYQLGWEPYHSAVIVYNPVIQGNMYVYLGQNKIWNGTDFVYYEKPFIIENGCAYISEKTLADLTHHSYIYEIKDAEISNEFDKYRRSGNVSIYNGINLLNGYYAFESVVITDEMAIDYASAVNEIAAGLPDNVRVYNMAIPNSSEFYAPKEYSTDLRGKYDTIYKNLSEKVTPVDIFSALFNKADDYIFFNSDHHWTQRGAYYAFEEFMKVKGTPLEKNYLETFGRVNSTHVIGSFASLMSGTEGERLVRSNSELLERFYPPYNITKDVYNDCRLEKYVGTGPLINKNILAYGTFIGGDVPVAKLHNEQIKDGSTLYILKDSYANAFAVWAICNYEYVYLVDIRCFNGANGHDEPFDMRTFQQVTGFNDLLVMSYPNTIGDFVLRDYIRKFA